MPELEEAWRLDDVRPAVNNDEGVADGVWVGQGRVAVIGDRAVTVVDAASGAKQGTIKLRGRMCLAAPDVNRDGVGAVLVTSPGNDDPYPCDTVVAVDLVRHRTLWRRELDVPYATQVAVGRRTVAVTNGEGGARRLRVGDGRRLPDLGAKVAAANGSTVIATDDARTTLQVFDQDSGRLRSTLGVPEVYDAGQILPGPGPVLVALNGARGSSFTNVSGTRSRQVGRELDGDALRYARSVRVADETVVAYDAGTAIDRVDPATGDLEQLTVLTPGERLVGADDDRLITTIDAGNGIAPGTLVRSIDPADPEDPTVLGTIPQTYDTGFGGMPTGDVTNGVLVVVLIDGVAAFRLPEEGIATSALTPATDGDLTPAQVSDLCTGLSRPTLAELGYRGTAGPPAHCRYYQSSSSFRGARWVSLRMSSTAYPADDDRSAEQSAEANFKTFVSARSGGAPLTALPGVGEQAAISADATIVIARLDNAVLRVELSRGPKAAAKRRAALEKITRQLLAEVERRRG